MPFLVFDNDPYMVVSDDGQLFWIYDAYTVSRRFPYSQPTGRINYIRNSVKVTINAYDGNMKFYMADKDDPIIRTISRIFPGTLQPMSEMPRLTSENISGIPWIFSVFRPWFIRPITWRSRKSFTTRKTSGRYRQWEKARRVWNPITR